MGILRAFGHIHTRFVLIFVVLFICVLQEPTVRSLALELSIATLFLVMYGGINPEDFFSHLFSRASQPPFRKLANLVCVQHTTCGPAATEKLMEDVFRNFSCDATFQNNLH